MTMYRVRLADGDRFLMQFDDEQASAPILANPDDDDCSRWQHTGYQTADAGSSETRAAQLVIRFWSSDTQMCAEVESVTALAHAATDEDADEQDWA